MYQLSCAMIFVKVRFSEFNFTMMVKETVSFCVGTVWMFFAVPSTESSLFSCQEKGAAHVYLFQIALNLRQSRMLVRKHLLLQACRV